MMRSNKKIVTTYKGFYIIPKLEFFDLSNEMIIEIAKHLKSNLKDLFALYFVSTHLRNIAKDVLAKLHIHPYYQITYEDVVKHTNLSIQLPFNKKISDERIFNNEKKYTLDFKRSTMISLDLKKIKNIRFFERHPDKIASHLAVIKHPSDQLPRLDISSYIGKTINNWDDNLTNHPQAAAIKLLLTKDLIQFIKSLLKYTFVKSSTYSFSYSIDEAISLLKGLLERPFIKHSQFAIIKTANSISKKYLGERLSQTSCYQEICNYLGTLEELKKDNEYRKEITKNGTLIFNKIDTIFYRDNSRVNVEGETNLITHQHPMTTEKSRKNSK